MRDLGLQRGSSRPREIEITNNSVFIATDIQPYEETVNDVTVSGYEYHYYEYGKDEYIELLVTNNNTTNAKLVELEEQLAAAKILLGVE